MRQIFSPIRFCLTTALGHGDDRAAVKITLEACRIDELLELSSTCSLALAAAYAGFTFSQRPAPVVAEAETTITKPAELLDWEDKQVQEFLDYQEDYWYPTDDVYDTPVSEVEEFEGLCL